MRNNFNSGVSLLAPVMPLHPGIKSFYYKLSLAEVLYSAIRLKQNVAKIRGYANKCGNLVQLSLTSYGNRPQQ